MSDQMVRETFDVKGMTCAACAARVQKALSATPGVTEVGVNLAMNKATIAHDPSVEAARLAEAVDAAGYELVTEPAPDPDGAAPASDATATAGAGRRVVLAAIFGIPVVA